MIYIHLMTACIFYIHRKYKVIQNIKVTRIGIYTLTLFFIYGLVKIFEKGKTKTPAVLKLNIIIINNTNTSNYQHFVLKWNVFYLLKETQLCLSPTAVNIFVFRQLRIDRNRCKYNGSRDPIIHFLFRNLQPKSVVSFILSI